MSALSIQPTYPIFTETDGQPLENGYIWIGTVNLDPATGDWMEFGVGITDTANVRKVNGANYVTA